MLNMDGSSRDNDEGNGIDSNHATLRREVEQPLRQDAGLGVMLVASAAMFFAVTSSAFILRAQKPSDRCLHRTRSQPVPTTHSAADCGEAVYQNNPDGTVSVEFELCPGSTR